MCESDTLARKLVKTGPVEMSILGCFFKEIQLAGLVCFALRSLSNTDPIILITSCTASLSACQFHLPQLVTVSAYVCIGPELCKASYWSSSVASFPLKRIPVAHLHLESRRGMRAPARMAVSHILLSIFHLNPPHFFLISPIPFSSQVHLAFIQKFNSALERLGLYLKPYH